MTRPIGSRIKSICALLQKAGPLNITQIAKKLKAADQDLRDFCQHVRKYCYRAVTMGLMTYKRTLRDAMTFCIVEGWEKLVGPIKRELKPRILPSPMLSSKAKINSVWMLVP